MDNKEMSSADKNTKNMIKNAFISNIIGVAMQYSPDNYKIMREKIQQVPVTEGADLFNVCWK